MFLCRVTGTVVATRKHENLRLAKLLIVETVGAAGDQRDGRDHLALDPGFGAGIGDMVLVAREGAVVSQAMGGVDVPTNVIILGVVDDWDVARDESAA